MATTPRGRPSPPHSSPPLPSLSPPSSPRIPPTNLRVSVTSLPSSSSTAPTTPKQPSTSSSFKELPPYSSPPPSSSVPSTPRGGNLKGSSTSLPPTTSASSPPTPRRAAAGGGGPPFKDINTLVKHYNKVPGNSAFASISLLRFLPFVLISIWFINQQQGHPILIVIYLLIVDLKKKKICEDSGLDSLLNLINMPQVKVQSLATEVVNSLQEGRVGFSK